ARSSMRLLTSEPLKARPIGVRAVATMTASGMRMSFRMLRSGRGRCGRGLRLRRFGLGRRHQSRRLDGGLGPALAADAGQLAQQRDRAGIVVAGTALDRAVLEHLDDDLAADVGAEL